MRKATNSFQNGARLRPPGRRQGFALLIVLSALVVATILAYGILASASMDAKSSANARAATEAEAMAESGANLAMHYLLRPEDSPVALVKGSAGDWHYPGEAHVALGDGSFQITVNNPSTATFVINVVGRSLDAEGVMCERKLRVRVVGVGDWLARGAAHFSSSVGLAAGVTVNADLVTDGAYLGGGTVTGIRYATNSIPNAADWGPALIPPEMAVPPFGALNLVRAMEERNRWYAYNNTRCRADFDLGSTLLLPPIATLGNTGNVFVYTGTTPLTLGGLAAVSFNGTLILTKSDLVLTQPWTITPKANLPALLVHGTTSFGSASSRLTVNGVYYSGKGFGTSASTAPAPVVVSGAFLNSNASGSTLGSTVNGAISITLNPTNADVPDLTDCGIRYKRLQIEQWESVN